MQDQQELFNRTDGIFFSTAPLDFDPVSGYRWRPGRIRCIGLAKGELLYDNRLHFNNWGQHCSTDYLPQKSSPRVFRMIVLGDSLTNGICMPRTWSEMLQETLRMPAVHGRDVEVYAFPVDGGGLLNWYEVFMRQVLPAFEFDALILGDTVNDGSNQFIVAHSTETNVYIGYHDYEKRPVSSDDFKRVFPDMKKYHDIVPEPVLDELVSRVRQKALLPPVQPSAYLPADEAALLAEGKTGLLEWYGERRLGMLDEMADACKRRGAPVIYYAMPRRPELLLLKKMRKPLLQQARAAAMAKRLDAAYFDGYSAFGNVTAKDIVDLCWLKYDGHWALPGATLFALKLAAWILRQGIIKR